MKKITLLSFLVAAFAFAQQPQSFAELDVSNLDTNGVISQGTTIVNGANKGATSTYTDRATWQADYTAGCGGATLTLEDFAGLPGGVTTCGAIISDAGDGCFAAGEIVAGISIEPTIVNGGDGNAVGISAGTIGNTIDVVGANSFGESTVVNFSVDVFAVGVDIWNNSDPSTEVRLYDAGGVLFETFTLANTVGAEDFFGFIALEPVSRIEIQEAADGGDLIGNLEFGDCTLSVDDVLLSQISLFPNPASDILNVKLPIGVEVESAIMYDVLGKNVGVTISNGEINVSELSRGVYILSLKTSVGTLTEKIVKR